MCGRMIHTISPGIIYLKIIIQLHDCQERFVKLINKFEAFVFVPSNSVRCEVHLVLIVEPRNGKLSRSIQNHSSFLNCFPFPDIYPCPRAKYPLFSGYFAWSYRDHIFWRLF
jgi:hypothetical protein